MSDQDRKKKDGRHKDKKNKAMRETMKERGHDARSVPLHRTAEYSG